MCVPTKPFRIESEFTHAGLQCAVTQPREAGSRCGYVRVPPAHPLHGKNEDEAGLSVHGGLTFAAIEPCEHEDGSGWWFGFDCAHWEDAHIDPAARAEDMTTKEGVDNIHMRNLLPRDGHYWTRAEVEAETRRLAEQITGPPEEA